MTIQTDVSTCKLTEKPRFRGRLHRACFFLSIPAGLVLVLLANDVEARIAALVYALGVATLYGVSGAYHCGRWTEAARQRMKRLDHAAIFVMIAGTYTPICLLVLSGAKATALLVGVWVAAAAGVVLALTGVATRRGVGHTMYITIGWLAVLALPEMVRRLSPASLALLISGAVLYTVGAFVLALKWPDPSPRVFGYHEVWHVMVVAASLCHAVVIYSVV
jgi:hemolysin III